MATETLLASRSFGEGLPVLIIHGWLVNGAFEAHDLEPVFAQRASYRRIYVDLPGMGSTPIGNTQSLEDMYQRLVHFIDTTLGASRFLLAGSSCGAYLARAVAHKYQDQVAGLLLRVPMVEADQAKRDLDPFRPLVRSAKTVASLSPLDRETLGELLLETPAYIAAQRAELELEHRAIQEADQAALARIRDDGQRYRLPPPAPGLFSAPTLILCGRQDGVVGYRDAMRLLELYPRATFAALDRGTHALPLLEQDVFVALVRDWLDRAEEWIAFGGKADNKSGDIGSER